MPPYQLIGLALLLVLLLALMFPRQSLQTRLLGPAQSDELAIAYLEAWQRVEPDNPDVLATLTREYLKGQRAGDAERLIARLRASRDPVARQDALLIEIGLAQSALFADHEPAIRQARTADLARLLTQALPLPWRNDQLEALARTARQSDLAAITDGFYVKLAGREPARAAYWWRGACTLRLEQRQYAGAADACLAAQAHAATPAQAREAFLAALRVLQMGNLLPQALEVAERHGDGLLGDADTLRFLTQLALAGGRPDLAQTYVRRLLSADRAAPASAPAGAARVMPMAWVLPASTAVWSDASTPPAPGRKVIIVDPALYLPAAAPQRVALTQDLPAGGQNAADLDLAYRVFMANGNLADAEKIARQALDNHMDPTRWRPRLAQAALWNSDPATALAQFLQIADGSHDERLWRQIETLAQGLNDAGAQLRVYQHRLGEHPGDVALIDKIVAAYELLGQPETALDFLQARSAGPNRAAVLSRLANLALRAGHDQLAIDTWRTLMRIDGPKPAYALALAQQATARAQFSDAMALLQEARQAATPADADYWHMYASLAAIMQDRGALDLASRQLQAGGNLDDTATQRWLDTLDDHPADEAQSALQQYRKNGNPSLLARALSAQQRLGERGRAQALLAGLSGAERERAENNVDFLLARADYAQWTGMPARALADWARAGRLAPERADVVAAWVSGLTVMGRHKALSALLPRYAGMAENDSVLLDVYAQAWMALGAPRRALHYFDLARAGHERDPLWQMSYAEALEQAGRPGAAWQLRYRVWRDQLPDQLARAGRQERRDILLANLVSLDNTFAGGDQGLARLRGGLAPYANAAMPPSLTDAATNWAQAHDADALARAWLAQHYANWQAQPAQTQFALARADGDRAGLEQLLAAKPGQLSTESRIEALSQTGRADQARYEAFAAAERQPDSDDAREALRDAWLDDNQTVTSSWRGVRQNGLKYDEFGLSAGMRLDQRQALTLSFNQRIQRTDPTQLPGAPGLDHTAALGYRVGDRDANAMVTVAARQSWRAITPVRLDGELAASDAFSFNYALGSEQQADETSQLLLGGMKNLASVGVNARQRRWFASGRVEADRFYLQDRSFLGEGVQESIDVGYKFRIGYPDYTLHLTSVHGQYSAYGSPSADGVQLVPDGTPLPAAAIMPQTFTQTALLFSVGTELPNGYSHALRPYLEAGPAYDTRAQWGGMVNVGLVGSVFGRDRLTIYYQHSDMDAQGAAPVTEVGVRYSWFY